MEAKFEWCQKDGEWHIGLVAEPPRRYEVIVLL